MDKIIYLVVTVAGGEDGKDTTSKGGKVILATFNKGEAEQKIGKDTRYELKKEITDIEAHQKAALAKLTEADKLVLGLLPPVKVFRARSGVRD